MRFRKSWAANVQLQSPQTNEQQGAGCVEGLARGNGTKQKFETHGLYEGKRSGRQALLLSNALPQILGSKRPASKPPNERTTRSEIRRPMVKTFWPAETEQSNSSRRMGCMRGKVAAEARHTFSTLRFDQTWVVHLHNGLFRCMVKDELVDRNVVWNGLTTVCAL